MPNSAMKRVSRRPGRVFADLKQYDHWGLITGSVVGIVAGPFGSLAGLFLGIMLDIAVGERATFVKTERYLANPSGEDVPFAEGVAGTTLFLGMANAWAAENGIETSLAFDLAAGILRRLHGAISLRAAVRSAAERCRVDSAEALMAAFGRTATAELRNALPSMLYGLLALSKRKLDPERDARIMGLCALAKSRDDYGTARRACFPSFEDPWKALGLPEGSSPDEVRRAYRRLSRSVHPDAPHGNAERFIAVHRAYEALR